MRIVAITQARLGSTRLPRKVLMDVGGESMLVRHVARAARARTLDEVVVATTTHASDTPIVELCDVRGWACFRGSEEDLLDRYYRAATAYSAEAIVRLTSDCPLIDPDVIDRVVGEFLEGQPAIDYASNILPPRTFPRGLDAEVMRFDALARAWREDDDPRLREHVTPYIYRNPDRFLLHAVRNDVDHSDKRWTVDTADDLTLVRRIYEHFGSREFSWREVLRLLDEKPGWSEINRGVEQKEIP